jgi:hypothetical protein
MWCIGRKTRGEVNANEENLENKKKNRHDQKFMALILRQVFWGEVECISHAGASLTNCLTRMKYSTTSIESEYCR